MQHETGSNASPAVIAILLVATLPPGWAAAQARYDDHPIEQRLRISVGGYSTRGTQTKLRVDSRSLGLGTLIDLEDNLSVQDSVGVARLDGAFRISRAHGLEWSYFSATRRGLTTVVDSDITIGGVVFPVDYRLASTLGFNVTKASYAWSFINTSKYEFFAGGGLNIRDMKLAFRGEGELAGQSDERVFENGQKIPLPTLSAGMRYQLTDKLMLRFRAESFVIKVGDQSGRWQESNFFVDRDFGKHLGVGGGLSLLNIHLQADLDTDRVAELDASDLGLMLYVSARF